jgi:hypothetical protein
MLQRSLKPRCTSIGRQTTAMQIFSFCYRNPPSIDAVILTGIPSRQIR